MRRGSYFFIAFIAAAITFASLMAFVNPKYRGMNYGYGPHYGWYGDGYYRRGWDRYRDDYYPPYRQMDSTNHQRSLQPENSQQ